MFLLSVNVFVLKYVQFVLSSLVTSTVYLSRSVETEIVPVDLLGIACSYFMCCTIINLEAKVDMSHRLKF